MAIGSATSVDTPVGPSGSSGSSGSSGPSGLTPANKPGEPEPSGGSSLTSTVTLSEPSGNGNTSRVSSTAAGLRDSFGRKDSDDKLQLADSAVAFNGSIPAGLDGAKTPDGKLNLDKITPAMIDSLSPQERRDVMTQLRGTSVSVLDPDWGQRPRAADEVLFHNLSVADPNGPTSAQLYAASPETLQRLSERSLNQPGPNQYPQILESIANNQKTFLADRLELDGGKLLSPESNRAVRDFTAKYVNHYPNDPAAFDRLSTKSLQALSQLDSEGRLGSAADNVGAVVGSLASGLDVTNRRDQSTNLLADLAKEAVGLVPGSKLVQAAAKGLLTGTKYLGSKAPEAGRHVLGQFQQEWTEARINREISREEEDALYHGADRAMNQGA